MVIITFVGKWGNGKRSFSFSLPGKWGSGKRSSDFGDGDCGSMDSQTLFQALTLIEVCSAICTDIDYIIYVIPALTLVMLCCVSLCYGVLCCVVLCCVLSVLLCSCHVIEVRPHIDDNNN